MTSSLTIPEPEEAKLVARKEKNRQAAARSRKRKQSKLGELETIMAQQAQEIETLKGALAKALDALRKYEGQEPESRHEESDLGPEEHTIEL